MQQDSKILLKTIFEKIFLLDPLRSISVGFFIVLFLVFRPYQMQNSGMIYTGDDYSYFAFSTSFTYFTYPDFSKEYVDETSVPPLSRVGPGLMATPFVFAFSLIDRALGNPIVEKRSKETIQGSWSEFGFLISSAFYFYASCVLLYWGLRFRFTKPSSLLSVYLMMFTQGAAIYAFRRPVFSHISELFLMTAFTVILIKKDTLKLESLKIIFLVTIISILSFLVRQNAIIFAVLFPILIFRKDKVLSLGKGVHVATAAYMISKGILEIPHILNPEPYEAVNKLFNNVSMFTEFQGFYFYLKRSYTVLFGADWGLVYTAPFLILGFIALIIKKIPQKRDFLILLLPIAVNFYLIVCWKGQGSYYGYRYFIYPAIPILAVPFTQWIQDSFKYKYFLAYMTAIAVVPMFSMILFEGTPKTTLWSVVTEFGEKNGGNLEYQIEVWRVLINNPGYFVMSFLKNGPAYLIYLLSFIGGFYESLPDKFKMVYPNFSALTLLKTGLLYVSPGIFFLSFRKYLKE